MSYSKINLNDYDSYEEEEAEEEAEEIHPIVKKIDRFFNITEYGSNFKTEIIAGIVLYLNTVFTLQYTPDALQGFGAFGNARTPALMLGTALVSGIVTLISSIYTKLPTVLIPVPRFGSIFAEILLGQHGFTFENVFAIFFLASCIEVIIIFIPTKRKNGRFISLREHLFEGIPETLRIAFPIGIGLQITLSGLSRSNVVVPSNSNLIEMVDLTQIKLGNEGCDAIVFLFTLFMVGILKYYDIHGGVIISIFAGTILGIPLKISNINVLKGSDGSWDSISAFSKFFSFDSAEGSFCIFFKNGFKFPPNSAYTILIHLIMLILTDTFGNFGTLVSAYPPDDISDPPKQMKKSMIIDSCGSIIGSCFGTPLCSIKVETFAGIASGAITGIASLTTGLLFLFSIFIIPIIQFIPSSATAAIMIYAGITQMNYVRRINFTDIKSLTPTFITIIGIPFFGTIAKGFGFGMLFYILINFICYIIDYCIFRFGNKLLFPKFPLTLMNIILGLLFGFLFFVPTTN
jgi:AGZA family xanthine/uracil permease-like MFS transporter